MLISTLHGPTELCRATFARLTIMLTRLCMPSDLPVGNPRDFGAPCLSALHIPFVARTGTTVWSQRAWTKTSSSRIISGNQACSSHWSRYCFCVCMKVCAILLMLSSRSGVTSSGLIWPLPINRAWPLALQKGVMLGHIIYAWEGYLDMHVYFISGRVPGIRL